MLVATYIHLLAKRAHAAPAAAPFVAGVNIAARGIDALSARLREPGPGTVFANYHVTAEP
jgi:hypothetical protein